VAWIGPLGGTVLAGLILAAAIAERIAAQEVRTTLSGVYTAS